MISLLKYNIPEVTQVNVCGHITPYLITFTAVMLILDLIKQKIMFCARLLDRRSHLRFTCSHGWVQINCNIPETMSCLYTDTNQWQ